MEYLKIQEVAPKWGVSTRNVQMLCAAGKIPGAVRFGRDWMIPKDAPKPADGQKPRGKICTQRRYALASQNALSLYE